MVGVSVGEAVVNDERSGREVEGGEPSSSTLRKKIAVIQEKILDMSIELVESDDADWCSQLREQIGFLESRITAMKEVLEAAPSATTTTIRPTSTNRLPEILRDEESRFNYLKMSSSTFIENLEGTLKASRIDQGLWLSALLLTTKDADRTWVQTNLVNKHLTWDVAKEEFLKHYKQLDGMSKALKVDTLLFLESMAKDEPVDSFTNKFRNAVVDAEADLENELVKRLYHSKLPRELQNSLVDLPNQGIQLSFDEYHREAVKRMSVLKVRKATGKVQGSTPSTSETEKSPSTSVKCERCGLRKHKGACRMINGQVNKMHPDYHDFCDKIHPGGDERCFKKHPELVQNKRRK